MRSCIVPVLGCGAVRLSASRRKRGFSSQLGFDATMVRSRSVRVTDITHDEANAEYAGFDCRPKVHQLNLFERAVKQVDRLGGRFSLDAQSIHDREVVLGVLAFV